MINSLPPPSISDHKKTSEELFAYEEYQEPEDVEESLRAFLDNYNSNQLGNMAIEDAIWYLEGASNYANRYEKFPFLETTENTISFTYSWSSGQEFSGAQLTQMMEATQNAIDALPSNYQFIATDFYLEDLGSSSITMATTIVAGLPSGNPPFNIVGIEAQANFDNDCDGYSGPQAAFKQVEDKAFKKYLNSLTFYPGTYIYYTATTTYGSVGRSVSSDKLFGGSNPVISSHAGPVDNSECIETPEVEAYRDEVLNKVLSLGKKPFMIKLKAHNYTSGNYTYGYWTYDEVRVSAENVADYAPES